MTKEIWANLPVANINKSVEFFTKMGFEKNERFPFTDTMASFFIGEKSRFVMMLFRNDVIESFCGNKVSDTSKGTEVLFSIDAESKEEVDEMLQKLRLQVVKYMHKVEKKMAGCMVVVLLTLMDIDGICYTWILVKWESNFTDFSIGRYLTDRDNIII